jgi:hypothetical protein
MNTFNNLLSKLFPFGLILWGTWLLWTRQSFLLNYLQKFFSGIASLLKEIFLYDPAVSIGILFIFLPIYYLGYIKKKIECLNCGHSIKKDAHECLSCKCQYTKSYYECDEGYVESLNRRWGSLKPIFKEAFVIYLIGLIVIPLLLVVVSYVLDLFSSYKLGQVQWIPTESPIHSGFSNLKLLLGVSYSEYFGLSFEPFFPLFFMGAALMYVADKREINIDRKNNWKQLIAHEKELGKKIYSEAEELP